LIKALKYLHSHKIIHRDLNLGNLLLTDKMEVKVGGFGLATKLEFEGERKRTVCGTPNYIAPEILDGKQGHSYEVDIWSLGVIIYTLIIGKPPFETQDVKTTYKRIKMNSYSFPEGALISDAAKNLITEILNSDPVKRPNLDQIISHDFFNQGTSIPKFLPTSILACPPSLSYIRQFMPDANPSGIVPKTTSSMSRDPTSTINSGLNTKTANITDRQSKNLNYGSNTSNQMTSDVNRPATTNYTGKNKIDNTTKTDTKNQISINDKNTGKTNELVGPDIWVKKWVDYSSKYGLGYLLSNGSTGVFFNDSSKIVLDNKGVNFSYIERRVTDKQEVIANHTLNDYPKELQKKVTLLQHFRSYLEGENPQGKGEMDEVGISKTIDNNIDSNGGKQQITSNTSSTGFVYVKKWMRTRHAIMFRLSNKIVQVCFQDHTEIILSSESRVVTYVNKKGERSTYPLNSALESNNYEMTKRLKYTKDILTHMLTLNNNQQGGAPPGTSSRGGTQTTLGNKDFDLKDN
jgi:polo-like kinase 1